MLWSLGWKTDRSCWELLPPLLGRLLGSFPLCPGPEMQAFCPGPQWVPPSQGDLGCRNLGSGLFLLLSVSVTNGLKVKVAFAGLPAVATALLCAGCLPCTLCPHHTLSVGVTFQFVSFLWGKHPFLFLCKILFTVSFLSFL